MAIYEGVTSLSIIPAKAGIQKNAKTRVERVFLITKHNRMRQTYTLNTYFVSNAFWIPAFAGMTKEREEMTRRRNKKQIRQKLKNSCSYNA